MTYYSSNCSASIKPFSNQLECQNDEAWCGLISQLHSSLNEVKNTIPTGMFALMTFEKRSSHLLSWMGRWNLICCSVKTQRAKKRWGCSCPTPLFSSHSVIFTVLDDAAYLCNAAAAALESLFHTLHNPKVSRYEPTPNLHRVRTQWMLFWWNLAETFNCTPSSWCIYMHLPLYCIW